MNPFFNIYFLPTPSTFTSYIMTSLISRQDVNLVKSYNSTWISVKICYLF